MKMRYSKSSLKRLASDLLQQRWLFLLATIGTIVQVALTIYLPILIGNAVDSVLLSDASQHLLPILSKMGMVIVANTAIQWLNPLIYNQLIYSYSQKLRDAVIQKIHRLPLAYLDCQGSGDLVSRLTTDVEQLNNGLLMVFNQFFVGVLTILVTIVTMARIDFFMMMLVLLLTPLSMLIARFIARKSYKLFQKQTTARGLQTQLIEESLSQESLIQSFNAQEQFITDFTKGNESYADYSQDAIFYSSTVNPATRFVNALIYAIVLKYVNQYTKPFNDISSVMAELQSALACAERLYMILDEKEVVETGKEELTSEAVRGAFCFEHVRFGYEKDKPLIHDLNMTVPAGSKVAIVGPTGAGKSTLINLLMRFYNVDAGKIKLDDRDITDYTRVSFRQQFGMVLQETWLKTATIHENIAFGRPESGREEVIAAAKAANTHFFIQQLPHGYDTYLADAGDSLSQGQRQLLTIARVFLAVPKILILDEATSSIDTRTEVLIQEAFNKLMVGRTSFIIAHRLSTIQNADIILVLVDGDIVEYGSHQELMQAKGVYYQMQIAQGSLAV